jgi:hypothetical protein
MFKAKLSGTSLFSHKLFSQLLIDQLREFRLNFNSKSSQYPLLCFYFIHWSAWWNIPIYSLKIEKDKIQQIKINLLVKHFSFKMAFVLRNLTWLTALIHFVVKWKMEKFRICQLIRAWLEDFCGRRKQAKAEQIKTTSNPLLFLFRKEHFKYEESEYQQKTSSSKRKNDINLFSLLHTHK